MSDFNLGDVVKIKNSKDENECYMITDIADFSFKLDGKTVKDIEYELMKMYPIDEESKTIHRKQNTLDLVAQLKSSKHKLLLQFILKERAKIGYFETPDYMNIVKNNILTEKPKPTPPKVTKKRTKKDNKDSDVVRYDLLKNATECRDAIYSLTWLYEHFGDEAYLQLREIVQARLVELIGALDTIDNCLDAMNILTSLDETFGSDDYLKLKDVIVMKLKQLI